MLLLSGDLILLESKNQALIVGFMSLFDHIGFESRNLAASYQFYAASLTLLGLKVLQTSDHLFFISGHVEMPLPFIRVMAADMGGQEPQGMAGAQDAHAAGKQPSGQHLHLKFKAANHAQVEAFYQAALATGGRDNAAPAYQGPQEMGYFAALVYDPDGHMIEVGVHERRL